MQRRQPNEDVVHDTVILTALHITRGRVYNELSRAYRNENFDMLVYKVDSDANTAGPGVLDLLRGRARSGVGARGGVAEGHGRFGVGRVYLGLDVWVSGFLGAWRGVSGRERRGRTMGPTSL